MICADCGNRLTVGVWPFCPHEPVHAHDALVHSRERTVVYRNPLTGAIRYPGRADAPMPQRYADQGYIVHEFSSAHELSRFERENQVCNERLNYNSGNGMETEFPQVPVNSPSVLEPTGSSELTVGGSQINLRSVNG